MKKNFLFLQSESIEIDLEEWKKRSKFKIYLDKVLVTLAPLV
jgi:hypothetical protein